MTELDECFSAKNVFSYFVADVKKIIANDFQDVERLLKAELYRQRQNEKDVPWDQRLPKNIDGLSADQEAALVERVFLDWMHFRGVKLSAVPRKVRVFNGIAAQVNFSPVLLEVASCLERGHSIADRLSRKLTKSDKINEFRKDFLFWNFGIAHIHLGRAFETVNRRAGGDQVLYAYIDERDAVFLEIGKHDFTMRNSLLRALKSAAPEILDRWELKGIDGLSRNVSEAERTQLVKKGVNVPIELDGQYYTAPGGGLVSSRASMKLRRDLDELILAVYTECMAASDPILECRNWQMKFNGRCLVLAPRIGGHRKVIYGRNL